MSEPETPVDDAVCVRCDSPLAQIDTTAAGTEKSRLAYHLRCQNETCPADGGTIVCDLDGHVTNRVGPVVDLGYYVTDGAVTVDGGPLAGVESAADVQLGSERDSATIRGESHG